MISSIFMPLAVLGVVAFLGFLLIQRGREGIDISPQGLLRLYLYLASLVGMLVLAAGLASATNAALAYALGPELIYGGPGQVVFINVPRCPPEAIGKGCVEPTPEQFEQQRIAQKAQAERQRAEDLIRGSTFAVFGGLFWGAHWAARRRLIGPEQRASALDRGYVIAATAVFGITTVIALPTGVQQILSGTLLQQPTPFGSYRQGADALGLGLVALILWLLYLRLAVRPILRGQ